MEAVFLQVLWVSLTVSAVLLPLLLARGWLRRRVRARALYVVWLVLALRLAIPVDLSLPEPVVTVEAPEYQITMPVQRPAAAAPVLPEEEEAEESQWEYPVLESRVVPVTVVLSALWLAGVLSAVLIQGGGYLMARHRLMTTARPDQAAQARVDALAGRLGLRRRLNVRRSGQIRTPMVLGLLGPVLLLPEKLKAGELVLCHELTHVKRRDLWYKALFTAVCCLHWFNPLVWWMNRVASENLELCCDDDVAAGGDADFRRQYGELLLSTAEEGRAPVLSSRFGGRKKTMKERLANLFVKKKRGRALMCAALAAVLLAAGLTACEGKTEMTDQEALDALVKSVAYDGERVSFTIPEGDRVWNIHIAGRADTQELGGISLHYLDGTQWVPGETYSFDLPAAQAQDVDALTMDVTLDGGAVAGITFDIQALLLTRPTYVNRVYGFTLTLPDGWADQVEIREGERGLVSFYLRDVGDREGDGWLAGICLLNAEEWDNQGGVSVPQKEQFLKNIPQTDTALYTALPTDVPVDESIPGALERYEEFCAQVPELLDSLTLTGGGTYAVAQAWLEEQVEAGTQGDLGYRYLDGRVERMAYRLSYAGYDLYTFDYSFLADHPENVSWAGAITVDQDGWIHHPYPMNAYLLMEGSELVDVIYSEIPPEYPNFWYQLESIPQADRWKAAAMAAFDQAYALEQLYLGVPYGNGEYQFTQEQLEAAGYQMEGALPDSWRNVSRLEGTASQDDLLERFRSFFSDALAQTRMDAMFAGPDAPYLFYEEELYFREDVPCGPGYDSCTVDWDSFSVTRNIHETGFDGIEFTLSGSRRQNGADQSGTWTFRLGKDETQLIRFYTWFDET